MEAPSPVVLPVFAHTIPGWQGFMFATLSPIGAVFFTNPIDTAKVRLQLQNRMKAQVYRNSFDCIAKILKNEGVRGIQQGLTPAIFREGSKNVFRLGLFEPIMNFLHDKQKEKSLPPLWKRLYPHVASATSGALGAVACNPFELVKTRLQAQTRGSSQMVGHQHNYSGMWSAFTDIIKKDGPAGLYKGSGMSVVRGIFGTASNLTTYSIMRDYLLTNEILPDSAWTDILCSSTSSLVTVVVMNPVDVVRTRVYNQPSPSAGTTIVSKDYYTGGLDAFVKVIRYEGVSALYKGFTTNFLRLAPHFTLTFLFLEQMRRMSLHHSYKKYQTEHQEQLTKLYDSYGSNSFDEAALVNVLQFGLPTVIEKVVKEKQFPHHHPFSFENFEEIVQTIEEK